MAPLIRPKNTEINWEVESGKIFNAKGQSLKDYKMLTRSDNGDLLNVCKRSYTPHSNADFKRTVDMMKEITSMELAGYSEIQGGKKILAYLKADQKKIAGFEFNNYMIIGNSHDYSTGFFIASTHEMLRCENQFARMYKGNMFTIPHTVNISCKIEDLVLKFESFMEEQKKMERKLEIWKHIEVDAELRKMMIERIINIELGEEESLSTRNKNKIRSIEGCFDREMSDLGENLFGLFQGVTYYTTHVYGQKEKVFGNVFGSTADINNKAFSFAQSIEDGFIEQMDLVSAN